MVLTDGVHVMGTNLGELHETMEREGVKRCHFQPHPRHPHYDVPLKLRGNVSMSREIVMLESTRDMLKVLARLTMADLWDRYFEEIVDDRPPDWCGAPWEVMPEGGLVNYQCHFCQAEVPAHEPDCVYLAVRMARADERSAT